MALGNFRSQMLWDNIQKGDLSAVVNLLENGAINLEERDERGQTFLMIACQYGELNIVRELLEAGIDPDAVDNDNWTALLYASKEGHLEIAIELMERGADIEHRDMCGWSALMWACYKGREMVVHELLDRGAYPNIKAEHNMTCLAWASGRGYTEIVSALLSKGAKPNTADKYGTTPLVWAARKGYLEIVQALLSNGANVDVAGMNSLTALLVATKGGYAEVVQAILEYDPNVNAVDKDGFTALTIAAKEGFEEIVQELLAKDAYVNVADRVTDTILIHAVKGGHVNVVRALLNRFADVDVEGSEGKTALYWAVEKGHIEIVRLLLDNDPDLEIPNKDGDTPLLRAVRSRNELCVRLLLDKGAKVSVVDKKGDTALHISLRARSKRITELLLRNPKNSRQLYKPNKSGETPYSIDAYHQKGILTQIHGHRNLNASDGENLLGYEIYSSALADILSDPTLNTPITVGLYAKWGSGKSFLLSKLQNEMKNFTQSNVEDQFTFTWSLFIILLFINCVVGLVLALTLRAEIGLGVGFGLFIFQYGFLGLVYVCSTKYELPIACRISEVLARRILLLTLFLKVWFCNPVSRASVYTDVPYVKFLFSESTKLTSVGGEKALAAMVASLSESLEQEFGVISTRLFSVFKPQVDKNSTGRFKTICCIPHFVIVVLVLLCIAAGVTLLVTFRISDNTTVNVFMITFACIVGLSLLTNIFTFWQILLALLISQKRRVMQAASQLDTLKLDGFMQKLKYEVNMMNKMVMCMDKFTQNTTRLVVIVDGLDSCEQEKVLQVLDIIQALFNDENSAFVTILAIDPQLIIKGLETNLNTMFHDSSVNGFDYLRNIVHLPFYLQSQGLHVQKGDMTKSSSVYEVGSQSHGLDSPRKNYRQQESVISGFSIHDFNQKSVKKGNRQKTDSISLVGHSSFDLTHTLTKNDYFSDINPRSMRRLMNIVAVIGRLLRAYNIEFNWYRLAAWINIIEQWPYRVSWIILFFEENEGLDASTTLQYIYEKVESRIPQSKEIEPLLEIDRNVRKLEAILSSKSINATKLNIGDLKKFLPCTINLDPYLRKLIREMQRTAEIPLNLFPGTPAAASAQPVQMGTRDDTLRLRQSGYGTAPVQQPMVGLGGYYTMPMMPYGPMGMQPAQQMMNMQYMMNMQQQMAGSVGSSPRSFTGSRVTPLSKFIQNYKGERLSKQTTSQVCHVLSELDGLNSNMLQQYKQSIQENNISGIVLASCDIDELKSVMAMKFGDWQIFKSAVLALREEEERLMFEDSQNMSEGMTPTGSENTVQDGRPSSSMSAKSFVGKNTSNISMSGYDSDMSQVSKQYPVPRQVSMESSNSKNSFDTGPGHFSTIKEESGDSFSRSLPSRGRMKRNDSLVAQLQYETSLLREAVQSFAEVEEGEDEDEEEEELDFGTSEGDNGEESTSTIDKGSVSSGVPCSRKRGLPVQFSLSSYHDSVSPEPESSNSHQGVDSCESEEKVLESYPLIPASETTSPDVPRKSILKSPKNGHHSPDDHKGEHPPSPINRSHLASQESGSVSGQSVGSSGFAVGEGTFHQNSCSQSSSTSLTVINEIESKGENSSNSGTDFFSRKSRRNVEFRSSQPSIEESIRQFTLDEVAARRAGSGTGPPPARHQSNPDISMSPSVYILHQDKKSSQDPESFL